LLKSPKLYWVDRALAVHLSGYYDRQSLTAVRELGYHFENSVLHHLRTLAATMTPRLHSTTGTRQPVPRSISSWNCGRRLIPIEVTLADIPRYRHCAGLDRFVHEYEDQAVSGLLIHTGRTVERLGEKIVALPWELLATGAGSEE